MFDAQTVSACLVKPYELMLRRPQQKIGSLTMVLPLDNDQALHNLSYELIPRL